MKTPPLNQKLLTSLVTSLLTGLAAHTLVVPAMAADQVLIMTIGNYDGQPLEGVKHDANNGLRIAQKLGYDTSRAVRMQDGELTLVGMKNALKNLVDTTRNNDRVFIYYSGHGGSSKRNNVCEQSLIAQDGKQLFSEELTAYLDQVKYQASRVTVMLDSCHAGGVLSSIERVRSASKGANSSQVKPKTWVPKDGESCSNGVNYVNRGISNMRSAKGMTDLSRNYVYITAARDNEFALDDSDSGGVASTAILKCLETGVPSTSNSGLASVGELVQCAQPYIEKKVMSLNADAQGSSKQWLPPHVNIVGNTETTLFNVPVKINTIASGSGAAQAGGASASVVAKNTLKRLLEGQDARWGFVATPSQYEVPLGEKFTVHYSSASPGYVTVLYVGSDGKDFKQLYPIKLGDKRCLANNQGYVGKDGGTTQFNIEAPIGENHFLVLLSSTPRDFSSVFQLGNDGGLHVNANIGAANGLGYAINNSKRNASASEDTTSCSSPTRNASAKENDGDSGQLSGYGAALFVVKGY